MFLNEEEKYIIDGNMNKGESTCLRILYEIGRAFQAEKMVVVNRAHISLSNQEGDLWFASKIAEEGAKCKVFATVNPAFDLEYFKEFCRFNDQDVKMLEKTKKVYKKLGVVPTYQCTPYLEKNVPKIGEVVSSAASSSSCFMNSVYGARTNRESAQSALCSAITGKTPLYGLLLEKNRKGNIMVNVKAEMKSEYDFQLLGYCLPRRIEYGIPVFTGIEEEPTMECYMNLCTQLNVHGVVPMFHMIGITPEASTIKEAFGGQKPIQEVSVTQKDLDEAKKEISQYSGKIDFVVLGCPHLTIPQIQTIARMLKGEKLKTELWIFTSHLNKELAKRMGLLDIIEEVGGKIVEDSCVDQPLWNHLQGKKGLTESPKCSYYVSRRNMKLIVKSLDDCICAAIKGVTQ